MDGRPLRLDKRWIRTGQICLCEISIHYQNQSRPGIQMGGVSPSMNGRDAATSMKTLGISRIRVIPQMVIGFSRIRVFVPGTKAATMLIWTCSMVVATVVAITERIGRWMAKSSDCAESSIAGPAATARVAGPHHFLLPTCSSTCAGDTQRTERTEPAFMGWQRTRKSPLHNGCSTPWHGAGCFHLPRRVVKTRSPRAGPWTRDHKATTSLPSGRSRTLETETRLPDRGRMTRKRAVHLPPTRG